MKKDFDEHIKQEGQSYRFQPRAEVWDRVAAELDTKKDRRPFFWLWWILPIGLAGIWVVIALFQQEDVVLNKKTGEPIPRTMQKSTKATTLTLDKDTKTTESAKSMAINQTHNAGKADAISQLTTSHRSTHQIIESEGKKITIRIKPFLENTNPFAALEAPDRLTQQLDQIEKNQPQAQNLKGIASTAALPVSVDSTQYLQAPEVSQLNIHNKANSNITQNQSNISDTLTPSNALVKTANVQDSVLMPNTLNAKPKRKNWEWQLVAGIGRHNYYANVAGGKLFGGGLQTADQSFTPTNPGANPTMVEPPKPGTGFMLGIEASHLLQKHPRWQWIAGLHYQYQTVRVNTGQKKDSTLLLENISGNLSNNRTSFYYVPGSAFTQTGNQHRMHLAMGAGWYLHKNKKWLIRGLAFGGMVFSADYLVLHTTQTGFIPVDKVLQKGYFGLETGLCFQPNNWGIGLYGQSTLTSALSGSLKNQYWRGAEFRIHYQLSSKK